MTSQALEARGLDGVLELCALVGGEEVSTSVETEYVCRDGRAMIPFSKLKM